MKRWLLAGLLVLTSACCGLSHTVNDDVFNDMSVDKKLRLFEAENDVSIALDEREQMRDRVRDLKGEMREAKAERRAAEEERDSAHDRDTTKLAATADSMWEKRLEYLDGSINYLHDRMDAQDTVVLLARAKFELAKALLIKRNKLVGADDINVRNFETQVAHCNERMRARLAEVEHGKGRLERLRSDWLRLREELSANNLRSLATAGDDELPVWEAW